MPDTRFIVADSIASVSREDWDKLTENDVYGLYGWLHTIETTVRDAPRPQYFLLYRDKQLIAAAAAYRFSRNRDVNPLDEFLFGRVASLASRFLLTPKNVLYFGPLIGQGRNVFWNKDFDADDAAASVRLLLERIAAREDAAGVTFAFGSLLEDEVLLRRVLRDFGCIETKSWPISYLDVRWTNFEDYIRSLSRRGKNLPTKIRREIMAPKEKGVAVGQLQDFGADAVKIHRLFDDTQRKHTGGSIKFGPKLIESLATCHSANCVMTVAKKEENADLIGCALLLTAHRTAAGNLIGIADQSLNREAFTYFNLALYAPVRFCIENNIDRIYFGGGLRRMKRRRGCNDMDVYIFMRPAGRVGRLFWWAWFLFHRRWVRHKSLRDSA